jgi:hypothetical protein
MPSALAADAESISPRPKSGRIQNQLICAREDLETSDWYKDFHRVGGKSTIINGWAVGRKRIGQADK